MSVHTYGAVEEEEAVVALIIMHQQTRPSRASRRCLQPFWLQLSLLVVMVEILTIGAYFTGTLCAVTGPSGPRYFASSKEAKFQNFKVASSSLSARVGLSSTLATRFWSIQAIYPQLTLKRWNQCSKIVDIFNRTAADIISSVQPGPALSKPALDSEHPFFRNIANAMWRYQDHTLIDAVSSKT